MTTLEFLENELSLLAQTFDITVKYHYDNDIYRHIVELTPQEEYYKNDKLDDSWIKVSLEFMKLFPDENISFVSDDSTLISNEHLLVFNAKKIEEFIDNFYTDFLNNPIKINYVNNFDFERFSNFLSETFANQIVFKSTIGHQIKNIEINHHGIEAFSDKEDITDISFDTQLPQAA